MKPKFNNKPNEQITTTDGKQLFVARDCAVCVCVSALTNSGKMYTLLSQRGKNAPNYKFHINLTSGYLDYNESLIDACKRELWEETGLNVDIIKQDSLIYSLDQMPWHINDKNFSGKQNVTFCYGLLFRVKDELPTVHKKNADVGEIEKVFWTDHENALEYHASTSGENPQKLGVWAFNDKRIFEMWDAKVKRILSYK